MGLVGLFRALALPAVEATNGGWSPVADGSSGSSRVMPLAFSSTGIQGTRRECVFDRTAGRSRAKLESLAVSALFPTLNNHAGHMYTNGVPVLGRVSTRDPPFSRLPSSNACIADAKRPRCKLHGASRFRTEKAETHKDSNAWLESLLAIEKPCRTHVRE